ncbi:MAG: CHASE domain-containing protein [Candidatus Parabeggiatoa sp.]|nr:CHASE domain-containing protein [Candidatus Parabeggiatoa sp.]
MKINKFSPAIVFTIVVGVMLSFTAFFVTRNLEWQDMQMRFDQLIDKQFASLKRELDLSVEVLRGVKGLFEASEFVSREEFQLFTDPKRARYPTIQALEWIPKVTAEQRAAYEASARKDGFASFSITERHRQGQMVPAGARAEYFPVFYMEPYKGNEAALGFDLASNTERLMTLTQSRDTGSKLATSRFILVQEQSQQFGFLIFVPIYQGKPRTLAERHKNIKGFVLGVYRIGDIFEKSINDAGFSDIQANLWLYEKLGTEDQLLHFRQSHTGGSINTDLRYQKTFQVAGRDWTLVAHPTDEYVAFYRTWYPYYLLVIALFFTILLTAYLRQQFSELRESKEQARAIVRTVVNGILTINQHGIIEFLNPAAEKLFAYTEREVIGQNVKILMPEPYHSEHDNYLNNYVRTGQAKVIGIGREVTGKRKNGTTFPMELAVSEMHSDKGRKFVGIVTEITERKNAEQMLIEAKEKAEDANRLKSEFLNVMSHELRTPLTVMLGNLPLLTDPSDLPEADEIAEIAQDIEESGKHLLTLINDLLDLSKIEAGKMKLTMASFSVASVFEDMSIAAMKKMVENKGMGFDIQFENISITADPVRLKQILFNLLGNAVKFTDEGKITVNVTQDQGMAYFSVQDTGCGMKEEDLPYIFEVFRQVDGSSKRAASGTGLGLAITKRLVELHKGEITVTSQIGVGSRFTFSIPII